MLTVPDGMEGLAAILALIINDDMNADDLRQAVNVVAEALAANGALIVDRQGKPAHGVTDERAVIGALATYARTLARYGHLDDALEVGELMDRVNRLPAPKPVRRA